MTMRPGPRIANSVRARARQVSRGATSPCRMVPKAPRMSPIWASSRTASRLDTAAVSGAYIGLFRSFEVSDLVGSLAPIEDDVRLPTAGQPAAGVLTPTTDEALPPGRQAIERKQAHEVGRAPNDRAWARNSARRHGRADGEDCGSHLRASLFSDRLVRPGRREDQGARASLPPGSLEFPGL